MGKLHISNIKKININFIIFSVISDMFFSTLHILQRMCQLQIGGQKSEFVIKSQNRGDVQSENADKRAECGRIKGARGKRQEVSIANKYDCMVGRA